MTYSDHENIFTKINNNNNNYDDDNNNNKSLHNQTRISFLSSV